MFDKLKQLNQIREMQNSLREQRVEVERNGTKVIVNGNFGVEKIVLNPALGKEEQEKVLEDALNEAMKKVQMLLVQKFSQMV